MNGMTKRKCVFAGTFDPPTKGHRAVVLDALKLFDEVVVAILVNPQKQPFFTVGERREMLQLTLPQSEKIRIVEFTGTADELLKKENAVAYVRGIRNGVDLDYENANYYASKKLDSDFLTVYLPCPQELLHVSSSLVRNCLQFHKPIDEFVTEETEKYIIGRQNERE